MAELETYLKAIANGETAELPEPTSVLGAYLYEIAKNGIPGGGGGTSGGGSVESWRLLYDATISENVSNVEITQDMNGNPFTLKKLYFTLKVVNNASNGSPYIYSYLKSSTANSWYPLGSPDGPGKGTAYVRGLFESLNDGHIISHDVSDKNYVGLSNNGLQKAYFGNFTGFKIAGYGSNTMDTVEMKVYGVDA